MIDSHAKSGHWAAEIRTRAVLILATRLLIAGLLMALLLADIPQAAGTTPSGRAKG
jgi:hypothetical protein